MLGVVVLFGVSAPARVRLHPSCFIGGQQKVEEFREKAVELGRAIGFDEWTLAWQVPEVHGGQPLVATENIGDAKSPAPPPCSEPPQPAATPQGVTPNPEKTPEEKRRVRRKIVAAVERSWEHSQVLVYFSEGSRDGRGMPEEPDAEDLCVSKRQWEEAVQQWRVELRLLAAHAAAISEISNDAWAAAADVAEAEAARDEARQGEQQTGTPNPGASPRSSRSHGLILPWQCCSSNRSCNSSRSRSSRLISRSSWTSRRERLVAVPHRRRMWR